MINQKQNIRDTIAILKKSLSEEDVAKRSQTICDRLAQTGLFQKAKCIALYYSIGHEVQTSGLMEEWAAEKQIVLPAISAEHIHFHPYTGEKNLKKSLLGILEPASTVLIPPENIDLFVIPGIAFDFDGNRLGRGKGYYDRYLSGINKPIIGLCFDFQLFENIPWNVHDVKMTQVITENTIVSRYRQ